MSLAFSRAPRKTAGNRMSKLLDAEEEDEFYKTTYGGFNDESGDDEYKGDQSDTEDEVDSDFDIDEGDEPDSDLEEDEPRRKRRVVTKAYKEPIKVSKPKPKPKKPSEPPRKAERAKADKHLPLELQEDLGESRKSVRQSTTEHTRLTYLRLQERQVAPRRRKGAHHDRPLTQDELLAEAKLTAEINLRSLENYERLEADKKKHVNKKMRFDGPTIRYHSVLMPLVTDAHLKEENVDVEGLDQDTPQAPPTAPLPSTEAATSSSSSSSSSSQQLPGGLCARTYLTFSDDEAFELVFPHAPPPRPPVQEVCPVTHKPALYRDPVTDIPYANTRAFKIIREAYKKYVAAHGLPNASGSFSGDGGSRGARQKIVIKQSMSGT
ncbi:vacuolar protein sorting-associated protein 72 homolog isoform X2 [Anguilla anguilla]|uniref:vacuolar protein sorting-associated protein 72 homolog isoform X1 n=1 Tax=Anguilla anguilla TaxID=7936 RepID=UPI0015A88529|nr:vacuolar protein sorting-associated protein 72 homolog isoform X1 [Anguilla anguilla]XP_035284774.1 vacuolar protein sorting-associated protein 72 homolog isoform X2 [Anguilla anguilla]